MGRLKDLVTKVKGEVSPIASVMREEVERKVERVVDRVLNPRAQAAGNTPGGGNVGGGNVPAHKPERDEWAFTPAPKATTASSDRAASGGSATESETAASRTEGAAAAGSSAAGSSTAGSATAGTASAGSSAAGSSTAGSSTAGSSTAGSSTAGSSAGGAEKAASGAPAAEQTDNAIASAPVAHQVASSGAGAASASSAPAASPTQATSAPAPAGESAAATPAPAATPVKINAQPSPTDPLVCKFTVEVPVFEERLIRIKSREEAEEYSPLARKLFEIPQIATVSFSGNVITVTKQGPEPWQIVARQVGPAIRAHVASGEPALSKELAVATGGSSSNDELFQKVQSVIETLINPGVASHGGFVTLLGVENDTAFIQMGGGCQGCGMADVTLKQGITATIRAQIPEIQQVLDSTDHGGGDNPYFAPSK